MGITTVNEYIDSLNDSGREAVNKFMDFMKSEFPSVTLKISYCMPMWWAGAKIYDGYVAVSAAKAHYSVHFHDEQCMQALSTILTGVAFGKRCVKIRYGDEKSAMLVMQSVKEYFNGRLVSRDSGIVL